MLLDHWAVLTATAAWEDFETAHPEAASALEAAQEAYQSKTDFETELTKGASVIEPDSWVGVEAAEEVCNSETDCLELSLPEAASVLEAAKEAYHSETTLDEQDW